MSMTKKELKDYCRKHGIKGFSTMLKPELEKVVHKYKKYGPSAPQKQKKKPVHHKDPAKLLAKVLERTLKKEGIYKAIYNTYAKDFKNEGQNYIDWQNKTRIFKQRPRGGGYYTCLKDGKFALHRERIKKQATWYADQVLRYFIEKNVMKAAPIFEKRKDIIRIELRNIRTYHGQIEANHRLMFSNGDEFTMRSQIVLVWGTMRRKEHHRYPTTFHDIKIKGKFYKGKSQKFVIDTM